MHKIAIILLGMASLAASGIITDNVRGGFNIVGGLGAGLQNIHGLNDIGMNYGVGVQNIGAFNKQELLRQKFILDILRQVHLPLQQQELLVLIDRNDITNEDLYMRPLTQDMLMVLDLIRNQQILDKENICTLSNDHHMHQMVGLYRLFVTARDFETFKRLAIYCRQYVNTEMFVNALILALGERDDTRTLVVPALHEILPQLYQQDSVIQQVQHLDTGVSTLRPKLVDVVGFGRANRFLPTDTIEQQPQGGLLGSILYRTQMWMPWRELHRQMAVRRFMGDDSVEQQDSQMQKLVVQLPGQGLLTQDIGLKAYVNVLIDELVVKQDVVHDSTGINTGRNYGIDNSGRRGQIDLEYNRNRWTNENNDNDDIDNWRMRRTTTGEGKRRFGYDMDNSNIDRDFEMQQQQQQQQQQRNIFVRGNNFDDETNKFGQRAGQRTWWRMDRDDDNDDNDDDRQTWINRMGGYENVREGQRDINTVSSNDARLLFVGRRRTNPNNVLTLGTNNVNRNINYMDDLEMISGGRIVDKSEGKTEKEEKRMKKTKDNKYNDKDDYADQQQQYNFNERFGSNVNTRADWMNNDKTIRGKQWQDQIQGQGRSMINGMDRDEFLNIVTHGSYGRKQMLQNNDYNNDEDLIQNGGRYMYNSRFGGRNSLDTNLPTTTIDDDRLLYINRRKLDDDVNFGNERRFMWNNKNYNNKYNENYNDKYNVNYNDKYNQNYNDKYNQNYNDKYNGNYNYNDKYNQNYNDKYNQNYNDKYNQNYNDKYNQNYNDKYNQNYNDKYNQNYNDKYNQKYNDKYNENYNGNYNYNYNDNDDDYNRRYGLNNYNENQKNWNNWDTKRRNMFAEDDYLNTYFGRDISTGSSRPRRSLDYEQVESGVGGRRDISMNESDINGKSLLQTLQQLVARLNVERIALGLPQLIDDKLTGTGRGGLLGNILPQNQQVTVNRYINTDSQLTTKTMQTIDDVIQQIYNVLQQQKQQQVRQQYSWSSTNDCNYKLNQIGLMLAGQIQEIGLLNIIGDIMQQNNNGQVREGQVANLIENENVQVLLAGIVKVVDQYVKEIFPTCQDQTSDVRDVTINKVVIDKLQTYFEQTFVDLSNLANENIDFSVRGNNKVIVGQVPRLNHKSFKIDIDVNSERQQQVVVRNMLVPKVDGRDNILTLSQQRQNAILLDITTVTLKPGRNIIKRKSKDITLTSCDTTPYTKIYERVMRALEGETTMGLGEQVCGQTDMLPHRLLVPRGRINGLPMQLVTVITPVRNTAFFDRSVTGLDILLLDHLPLNYPLYCDNNNLEQLSSTMANVMVNDVKIYHDDKIKMPLINMY